MSTKHIGVTTFNSMSASGVQYSIISSSKSDRPAKSIVNFRKDLPTKFFKNFNQEWIVHFSSTLHSDI